MKKSIRLNENELGHDFLSLAATAIDDMNYYGYKKQSNVVKSYLENHEWDMIRLNKIVRDVIMDARNRYKNGDGAEIDDFDDFIHLMIEFLHVFNQECSKRFKNIVNENRNMNKKQTIKLNESQLNRLVKETVKRVLNEQFGVDLEDTLPWVRKKNPEMSDEEQMKFAQNIINKRKRERDNKADDDGETYSLSFYGVKGGYQHHTGLTKGEAKYYYLKYIKYGDVDITYRDEYGEEQEVNPKYILGDED